jgi:hypothetical protein
MCLQKYYSVHFLVINSNIDHSLKQLIDHSSSESCKSWAALNLINVAIPNNALAPALIIRPLLPRRPLEAKIPREPINVADNRGK